jgi:serine/threonine protein kinase
MYFSAKQGDLQLALELEGCLEESQAKHVTKQVLEAVAFLHENKVVHLDIKVLSIYEKKIYDEEKSTILYFIIHTYANFICIIY